MREEQHAATVRHVAAGRHLGHGRRPPGWRQSAPGLAQNKTRRRPEGQVVAGLETPRRVVASRDLAGVLDVSLAHQPAEIGRGKSQVHQASDLDGKLPEAAVDVAGVVAGHRQLLQRSREPGPEGHCPSLEKLVLLRVGHGDALKLGDALKIGNRKLPDGDHYRPNGWRRDTEALGNAVDAQGKLRGSLGEGHGKLRGRGRPEQACAVPAEIYAGERGRRKCASLFRPTRAFWDILLAGENDRSPTGHPLAGQRET